MQRNRHAFNADTHGTARRRYFSPTSLAQFEIAVGLARQHCHGDLLDIGAGDVPYRDLLLDRVASYRTVDFERRSDTLDFVADAQDMSDVIDPSTFDSVVIFEVLEHVREPAKVVAEIHRVLRPGGVVVASVPHLSRLHEEPHDYFRFTKFGLTHVFEQAGFRDIEVTPRGGLFSFIGHQVSTIIICATWHIPVVRQVAFAINKWFVVRPAVWLDQHTDHAKKFAHGYVLVARR